MRNIKSHSQKLALLLCFASFAFEPNTSQAIANPETVKESTPVVLKCLITRSNLENRESISEVIAICKVLDVVRSTDNIQRDDFVTIQYTIDNAPNRSEESTENEEREPGLEIPAPPAVLQLDDVLIAYLRRATTNVDDRIYSPNLGFHSFEFISKSPRPGQSSNCKQTSEGPIMANEKVCAAEKLENSTRQLDKLFADILAGIERQRPDGSSDGDRSVDAALSGQTDSLVSSQDAWKRYRDDSCRYAYFTYFPGSLARLVELDCLQQVTGDRITQLTDISTGPK